MNCSNTWPLVCMYAVHHRIIDYRVCSKIPGMSAMVPAATRSSVSTTVSYTRSPDLMCLDFFLWGHTKQLVYENVVEQKKTSSLELPSLLRPLQTRQKSSNGQTINGPTMYYMHTDQWSRIRAVHVNSTAVISMLN